MNKKIFSVLTLFCLCCFLSISISLGQSVSVTAITPAASTSAINSSQYPKDDHQVNSTRCETQPFIGQPQPSLPPVGLSQPVTLDLFRIDSSSLLRAAQSNQATDQPSSKFKPIELIKLANPTNYGERFIYDIHGQLAYHDPIVVLHETVTSAQNAISFFQTSHLRDEDQASYHTLIERDGKIIYLVPPSKRAFGAGNSVFMSSTGAEAVQTNPNFPASVNNFAYHVSLESPADGNNNGNFHSGYTAAQYQSLAWLIAKTNVPEERITTHKAIDRSGTRKDPRSFDYQVFWKLLESFPKDKEIIIGCSTN